MADDTVELLWNTGFDLNQFAGGGARQERAARAGGDAAYAELSADLRGLSGGPVFGLDASMADFDPAADDDADDVDDWQQPAPAAARDEQVRVQLPDDSVVYAGVADLIGDLKQAVCARGDVPFSAREVSVVVDGCDALDEWRCADCGVRQGSAVTLRLKSGHAPAASTAPLTTHARPEEVDFHRALKRHLQRQADPLELLEAFRGVCGERQETLHADAAAHGRRRDRDQALQLRQERDTWHLLAELHRLRAEGSPAPGPPPDVEAPPEDAMLARLRADPQQLLHMRVVRWAEAIAGEAVSFEDEESTMWPRTLRALQSRYREGRGGKDLVASLDPDAPLRGGGSALQREDQEAEVALLRSVWQFVRAGRVAEAEELCVQRGQPWRAASLAGGRPVGVSSDDGSRVGNPHREVWKNMCWQLAESAARRAAGGDDAVAVYESATYAVLSNNLERLLQSRLCQTWEAHVWAYFKAAVDRAMDEALAAHGRAQRVHSRYRPGSAGERHAERSLAHTAKLEGLDAQGIFEAIAAADSAVVRDGAEDPQHKVQAAVIEGRWAELVAHVVKPAVLAKQSPIFLRFAAHLALYLAEVAPTLAPADRPDPEDLYLLVCAYVEHLTEQQAVPQVALYVSQLPSALRVELYSKLLERVTREDERALSLRLGEELFPEDIAAITKRVVEAIRARPEPETETSAAADQLSPQDEERVKGLEWLCFDDKHKAQAISQGNALIRSFVAAPHGPKLQAAARVLQLLPPQALDAAQRTPQTMSAAATRDAIREHCCWRQFAAAHEAYVAWRGELARCRTASRPGGPAQGAGGAADDDLGSAMAFVNRVAAEQRQNEANVPAVTKAARAAQAAIQDTLRFEGGWLQGCTPRGDGVWESASDSEDGGAGQDESEATVEARAAQLAGLRRLCVPQLLFMLHRVLFDTGDWLLAFDTDGLTQHALLHFRESLNIADLAAAHVTDALGRDELAQLLRLAHKSTMAVMRLRGSV